MPAITKTKKVSADEARHKLKDRLVPRDGGDVIQRASRAPVSWNPDKRSARFRMTTEEVDRYGDIVRTDGLDTTQFEKNPVGLMFHNSRTWPIGNWDNLEKILTGRPKRLEGDLILLPADGPVPEVDQAAWMIEHGGIRANSIGFVPDWNEIELLLDEEGQFQGYDFIKSELVECSICPIPANPGALMKHAAGDMKMARELIEYTLDTYSRTPEGLLVPRAEFEKAYKVIVEKVGAEKPAQLPVTDDEKAAAEIRNIEFEVANLIPAIAGASAAVEGDGLKAKLQVVEGKWKHVGEIQESDVVNFVIVAKAVDGKRTYEACAEYNAAGALPQAKRAKDGTWWKVPSKEDAFDLEVCLANLKKGDTIEIVKIGKLGATVKLSRADGSAQELQMQYREAVAVQTRLDALNAEPDLSVKDINVKLTVDTKEAEAAVASMGTLVDSLKEKMQSIFGRYKEIERVEPKLDTPPAAPSAEAIAAVKARTAAMRQRAEKVLT